MPLDDHVQYPAGTYYRGIELSFLFYVFVSLYTEVIQGKSEKRDLFPTQPRGKHDQFLGPSRSIGR